MKRLVSTLLLLVGSLTALQAQIIAGQTPANANLQSATFVLSVDSILEEQTEYVDLNCDGVDDLKFILNYGFTAADAPTRADVQILNSDVEICAIQPLILFGLQVSASSQGQVMTCSSGAGHGYYSDTTLAIGHFGGFFPIGPYTSLSSYLLYTINSDTGWVYYNYNVDLNNGPIYLGVGDFTAFCSTTGLADESWNIDLHVFPNPTENEFTISWNQHLNQAEVQVLNLLGEVVHRDQVTGSRQVTIDTELEAGYYLVSVTNEKGQTQTQKIVVR